jgi:hypothetical protein
MNVDLVLAMIRRREQSAKDSARKFERDATFKQAARDQRVIQGAMAKLRRDIEDNLNPQEVSN